MIRGTYPFQESFEEADGIIVLSPVEAQPSVDTLTGALGWTPGIEWRPSDLYWRDFASVVVPSYEGAPYTCRVVWPDGTPVPGFEGRIIAGFESGSRNPGVAWQ